MIRTCRTSSTGWRRSCAGKGTTSRSGTRLGEWIRAVGLELVEFEGRFDIPWLDEPGSPPPNAAARAARQAMLDAGIATAEDGERWDAARDRYMASPAGKYYCLPILRATGRRTTSR